ncbi:MAG: exodeoxyribonuclease III [Planctomycetota bacterium]|nr:exodeoxyribonuclease III [Planctomycetota bacterium]MDG1983356.1 exodeoxyribonuclease III [Planctomycetota bacterium]
MDIVSWNVNSLRARMPRVLEFLERADPDVVCLQETKVVDELFPREVLEEAGYHVAFHGQKTYNGVAILSKTPLEQVVMGIPGTDHPEARVIAAVVEDVMLLDLYVVNGKEVGCEKYDYKLEWMKDVASYVRESFPMTERVVVTGDFNVTFDDRDIYDPERWRDRILCSKPEREALAEIMAPGLKDALRKHNEEAGVYTWWDFRTFGFKRGNGLRIDHFLLSPSAYEACTGVTVDLEARGGEKPSDHAPVICTLS